MPELHTWPTSWNVAVFLVSVLVIAIAGSRLAWAVDRLADRTGLGEALTGAVLLGATTSLSGSVLSVTAALNGRPELAIGNAVGGIAVQTVFLAVADVAYPRANLEHAAASTENMMQGALLVCLLAIQLLAVSSPEVTVWGAHPATFFLFATYIYGISQVRATRLMPMWHAERTGDTRVDTPMKTPDGESLAGLWLRFGALGATIGFFGWVLEHAASALSVQTGIGQTAMGVLLTSVSTSLPELVTSIAAVRAGALTLAVGGIIGGNSFDTLFAAFSDIAYQDGSIYHAISVRLEFWLALSVMMTGVLLMGLIRRERFGFGGIGFESVAILGLYAGAVILFLV